MGHSGPIRHSKIVSLKNDECVLDAPEILSFLSSFPSAIGLQIDALNLSFDLEMVEYFF